MTFQGQYIFDRPLTSKKYLTFKDIYQRLRGRNNWVCPGGIPPPVQLYAQRAAWEGYQGD